MAVTTMDGARPASFARLKRLSAHVGLLPIGMAVMLLAMLVVEPRFFRWSNMVSISREFAVITIAALGQGIIMIAGAMDLSIGAIVALSSVAAALTMTALGGGGVEPGLVIAFGVVAGLGAGALAGLANGLLIARLKVDPFVVTIGTSAVILGLIFYKTYGVPVYGVPESLTSALGRSLFLGLPVVFWLALAITVIIWALMALTPFGRHIHAVGGNASAARHAGIRTDRVMLFVFFQAGLLAAVIGLFYTARLGSGQATLGVATTMQSISAAVIGGVALTGGRGSVVRIALGALLLAMLQNALTLSRVDSKWQMAVFGAILIFAAVVERHALKGDEK